MKHPCVYILASKRHGTLYTGVTSDLPFRMSQHKDDTFGGFTSQYGIKMLVWLDVHAHMESAITREKQLKKWNRAWKIALIEKSNPLWRDLTDELG